MAQAKLEAPTKTIRGTWDEILAHSSEIPKTSELELRIFEPQRNTLTMALMKQWLEEDATDDLEEVLRGEEELAQFKRDMNANRTVTGERLPYPDVAE